MNTSSTLIRGDYYKATTVCEKAEGRWLEILGYLAPELDQAIDKLGKHVPCPIHGGRDGFRLKKSSGDNGFSVCNTCGINTTGTATLMWLKGWSFPDTLEAVARYLGLEPDIIEAKRFGNKSEPDLKKPTPPLNSDPAVNNRASYSSLDDVPFVSDSSPSTLDLQVEYESVLEQPKAQVIDIAPSAEILAENIARIEDKKRINFFAPTPERMAEIKAKQEAMAKQNVRQLHRSIEKVEQTWRESLSIDNGLYSPMRDYLKSRGVLLGRNALTSGDCLRYHPALEYWEEDDDGAFTSKGKYPAIIAAVRDNDGNLVTVHRTFLTKRGGKAPVSNPRKMLPLAVESIPSVAIKLGGMPLNGVLGVAEGFETALSPMKIFQIPTWSLINATLMEKFIPPAGVHTLLIWADKDKSSTGQKSAQVLKEKMIARNIRCKILLPMQPIAQRSKSIDWNDVLLEFGAMGFPSYQQIKKYIQ